jgi:Gpi18-like mannosyltransferase
MDIDLIPYIAHLVGFIGTLYEIDTVRKQKSFEKEPLFPVILGIIGLLLWFVYDYEKRAMLPTFFLFVAILTNLYVLYRAVRDRYCTKSKTPSNFLRPDLQSSASHTQSIFDPRLISGYKIL